MTVIFSVIYGATVFAITTPGLVPEQVLWLGQAANIPMVVLGKMIQVIANFRQGQRFFDQFGPQTTYILNSDQPKVRFGTHLSKVQEYTQGNIHSQFCS